MSRSPVARLGAVLVVALLAASTLGVLAVAVASAAPASPGHLASGERSPASPGHLAGPHSYLVTFSESGLPSGLLWQVMVGHSTSSTTTDGLTDDLVFSEPNGTYSYTVSGISGWQQSTIPYKGSLTVSAAPFTEPTLMYTQVTYSVSFSETGVPSGETFQVAVNGTPQALTTDGGTDTLTFLEPNGTWSYAVSAISGWAQSTIPYRGTLTVHGAALAEPTLTYTQVTYTVQFSETGLPAGLTFAVSVDGTPMSLTTTNGKGTLTWTGLPNGTYPYAITKIAGWQEGTLAMSGTVVVNDANTVEPTLAYTKSTFPVIFSESGLPAGKVFQVTVGANVESVVADGGTDLVQFVEPNGTFTYRISTISGWYQATLPYHGSVTISGAGVTETTVNFVLVTYGVGFSETGLPAGTNWSLDLNGSVQSTTGTSLQFIEPNGSYPYKVGYIAGYATTLTIGTQVVSGSNTSLTLPFAQVTYTIVFSESGLPTSSLWSVHVDSRVLSTHSTTVSTQLPNGTFDYTIPALAGYVPIAKNGSVLVSGAGQTVPVPFRLVTYAVTFSESGLPTGHRAKSWSVTLGDAANSTKGTSMTFYVGNGTYTYLITGPSGYRVSSVLTPQGQVRVNGLGVSTSVVFLKGSTGNLAFHEQGLASGTSWCATVGAPVCSTGTSIIIKDLTPGTYNYSVGSIGNLTTIVRQGHTVLSASGAIALVHSASLKVEYAYPVTFHETGLTGSYTWKVSAGGTSVSSSTNTIVLYLKNGSYSFHVGKISGEVAAPASGGVQVAGGPLTVNIKFTAKS